MAEDDLWRDSSMKKLVAFLSSARIEDYDAVAYDIECDFDPSNIDAVRYVASNAVAKARPIIIEKVCAQHTWSPSAVRFVCPIQHMPTDGSVAKFGTDDGNETVQMMRKGRLMRENYTEARTLYVPDATKYYKLILSVLCDPPYIADEDRTDEELRTLIAQEREQTLRADKSNRREEMWQRVGYYAFVIGFVAFIVTAGLFVGIACKNGFILFLGLIACVYVIYLARQWITEYIDLDAQCRARREKSVQSTLQSLDERLERLNKREEYSER